jgi:hypothetical protein
MRYVVTRAAALLSLAALLALTGCATAVSPGGQHTPARQGTAEAAPAIASCTTRRLHLAGGREGASETAVGFIDFTNTGSRPCTLRGYPQLALYSDGRRLRVHDIRPRNLVLQAVVLAPGKADAAQLVVDWGNWCGRRVQLLSALITIPGTGTVTIPFNGPPNYDYTPQCVQPGRPSQLLVTQAYAGT